MGRPVVDLNCLTIMYVVYCQIHNIVKLSITYVRIPNVNPMFFGFRSLYCDSRDPKKSEGVVVIATSFHSKRNEP